MQSAQPSPVSLLCVGFVFKDRPVVESSALLGGARSLIIRHEGDEYRLELTRNGKLILKK